MGASSEKKSAAKKSHIADIPRVEWIIGALGLLVVACAFGLLIYEAVAGDQSPPDVKLTVQAIVPQRNGYLVRLRAENEGGEAAARVLIKVELVNQTQVVEVNETQFEYLPAHSARGAGVFFTHDPRQGELRLQARGYEEP